jgi:HTH-type transcriptional regulator/antitoxin HigA
LEEGLQMMSTLTAYESLLLDVRPRPIRSKPAYRQALRHVEDLMSRPHPSRAESEMVELLSMLIEQYEEIELPTPDASPVEILDHLIEVRGVTNAELSRATGIPRSVITNVRARRRAISKAAAIKMADYFHVSPSLFIQAPVIRGDKH